MGKEYPLLGGGCPFSWRVLIGGSTVIITVRSYGVLLWEILSRGAFPYAKFGDDEVVNAVCHTKQLLPRPCKECPDRV